MKLGTHRLVTESFIVYGATKNRGWTKRQIEILGESWPPQKGWKVRACARMIPVEDWDEFLRIGRESVKSPPKKPVEPKGVDFGSYPIAFGKHKGLLWRNVPRDYLKWIVATFEDKESFAYRAAQAVLRGKPKKTGKKNPGKHRKRQRVGKKPKTNTSLATSP
jgi:hypothetical protein